MSLGARRCLVAATLALSACAEPGEGLDVVVPPCVCDDHDPCTDDRCDPVTRRCVFVPREPERACTTDLHCDDDDPCTVDACWVDPVCGHQRCRHTAIAGCRSCAEGCEPEDHCTRGSCGDDGLCRFEVEPLCDPRCRDASSVDPERLEPGAVTASGIIAADNGATCVVRECACTTPLLMRFGNAGALPLEGGNAYDEGWSCTIDGLCGSVVTSRCSPLEVGRQYIVWGEALAPAAPAAAPTTTIFDTATPTRATRVRVDGYCLAASAQGVAGRYAATLALDGEPDRTFPAELDERLLRVRATGDIAEHLVSFATGDGATVRFPLAVGERALDVTLYPAADRLRGPVELGGARVGTLVMVLAPPP